MTNSSSVGIAMLAVVIAACEPPVRRPALQMIPIGTMSDPAPTDASSPTPSSTSATSAPNGPKESACTMSDVDSLSDALQGCVVPTPKSAELPSGLATKLELTIATDPPSTQPGGHVDVILTVKNKTNDSLPLYFTGEGKVRFEVEAFDARGKGRVDLPTGKAPRAASPPVRTPKTSKIVLLGGGTAKIRLPWDAVKTRWAPEKVKTWDGRGPARAGAADLPSGKYQLRIPLPLLTPDKADIDTPKVVVDVSK